MGVVPQQGGDRDGTRAKGQRCFYALLCVTLLQELVVGRWERRSLAAQEISLRYQTAVG